MKRFSLYLFVALCYCLTCNAVEQAGRKFTLVIDAGHGGKDPGAIGKTSKEKNINLSTALAFGRLVEQNCPDVKVVYTRKTDVFVTLQDRASVANRNKADLFISIHTNALPKGKVARGAETYTLGIARAGENLEVAKRENAVILVENDYETRYHGFDPRSSESYIIFELMQDQNMAQSVSFAKQMQRQFRSAGRVDKGVHQAGFLVLRETTMPSALIELGYITTPDEERFLASSDGAKTMGRAIYNAFLNYRKAQNRIADTSAQPVAEPKPTVQDAVADANPVQVVDGGQAQAYGEVEFRVQFMSCDKQQALGRFSDLDDVDCYRDGGMYKYTSGHFVSFAEAQRHRNIVAQIYKGAFVIALCDGVRIDINEAKRLAK